jgi:hypothetical protein
MTLLGIRGNIVSKRVDGLQNMGDKSVLLGSSKTRANIKQNYNFVIRQNFTWTQTKIKYQL